MKNWKKFVLTILVYSLEFFILFGVLNLDRNFLTIFCAILLSALITLGLEKMLNK